MKTSLKLLAATIALAFAVLLAGTAEVSAQNTVALDKIAYSVAENSGSVSVLVRVTRASGNRDTVSVDYTTVDGTAMQPGDYKKTAGTLTFAAGETAKAVQIPIVDDNGPESTEKFVFQLSNPTNATLGSSTATATITITDNDKQADTISFKSTNYSVNEGAGQVVLHVTRRPLASKQTISVNYTTAPGTADDGNDYTGTSGTVTFNPGTNDQMITVPILQDSEVEGDQTFSVTLTRDPNSPPYNPANNTATVTIADDDTSTVNFSSTDYSIAEDGGNAVINLIRTGNTNSAASVQVITVGGSATPDRDYATTALTINFAPGEASAQFEVPILDDSEAEGQETFQLSLSSQAGSGAVIGAAGTATVTIVDNEGGTVEFSGEEYSVREDNTAGAAITVRLERSANQNSTVTVRYFTGTGTATPGQDYTAISEGSGHTLTFLPGETTKTFVVPILNDHLVEDNETVGLFLSNATNANLGSRSNAILDIVDDDSAGVVQFSSANYAVFESAGSVSLPVILNRTGDTNSEVTVDYATAAGSATNGRFVPTNGTLSFAPGASVATITVPIINDSVIETLQTFQVLLSHPQNASLGNFPAASVSISDDDGLNTVEFDAAEYGVVEVSGSVNLTVRALRGADSNQVLTVGIKLSDETAVSPGDYGSPSSSTITFPAGISVATITVPIANNPAAQGIKTFHAELVSPGDFTSIGRQATARVTIFDNSGPNTAQFLTAVKTVHEGDQAEIALTVVRYGDFNAAGTTVSYRTEVLQGDLAEPGVNFTSTSGSIKFAALIDKKSKLVVDNEHQKLILIPLPNNSLVQGDVSFHVTLTSSDVAQFGTISSTKVIVTDDDLGNVVQFDRTAYSVAEDDGNARLTVVLDPSGDASKSSTVSYSATQISAYAGYDFSPVTGTLTFAPGEMSKDILVPINNDSLAEPSEMFRVTLSDPGPGTLIGDDYTAVVTILDDETSAFIPVVASETVTTVQGKPLTYQIIATKNPTGYGATGLPKGLSLNATTGVITGTPTVFGMFSVGLSATNSSGTGTGTLTLNIERPAPVITSPRSASLAQNARFNYQVTATNNPTSFSATGLPAGLMINPGTGLISGNTQATGTFHVQLSASNAGGTGTAVLTVTVYAVPVITSPSSASGTKGKPFSYQITATGNPTSYDANGLPSGLFVNMSSGFIGGTPNVTGTFQVQLSATGSDGATGTKNLTLTISEGATPTPTPTATPSPTPTPTPTPTPGGSSDLQNVSTRAQAGDGNDVLIGGFIIKGNEPKKVIVRAIGPSLEDVGIHGFLADPTLELFDGTGTSIKFNDDWKTGGQRTEIEQSGVPPGNEQESAIVMTLAAGNYTAVVRGASGGTGVALVEAYDLAPNASLLVNISTRSNVSVGDRVMIGGFIIGSDVPTKVIVRAIGPSLAQLNPPVQNALMDPSLELRDGEGSLITSNDNWVNSPQKQQIQDSGVAPTDNRESAIVATLPKGNYTAIVRSSDGNPGVGLVEVYRLTQ
jgi:cell shape-determining protein MreC